jgi:hypothetical protein
LTPEVGRVAGDPHEPERIERLLRTFFPDYLRLVDPEAALDLDLDQTLLLAAPLDGPGVAARIPCRENGERVTVLAHIESEAPGKEDVARRLTRSLTKLAVPYSEPVLASVLFLRSSRPGARLESGVVGKIREIEVLRLYFVTFGLSAARAEPYLARPEPLAWAFAARMRPTQRTPEEHRAACLERIERAGLDEKRRKLLRSVVEA